MKKHLNLQNILIVALIIVILLQQCGKGIFKPTGNIIKVDGKKYEVVKHEIDTFEVEKVKTITKKGEDIYHDTTIYVEIPTHEPIDTMTILKDFYAKNVYKDTLTLDDSLGSVVLLDTIFQNKLLHRTFTAKVKERLIKETTIVKELPKRQVYFGGNLSLTKEDLFSGAGLGFLYKNKKDVVYHFGGGLTPGQTANELIPVVNLGLYWKIRLKR